MENIQNRFRSKAAWSAVITLVCFVLKTYFKFEIPQVDELVNYILITGTVIGVFNNPESSDKF